MDALPSPPIVPTINRALIKQDLEALAQFLAPLIQSRLETVRGLQLRFLGLTVPVGSILYPLLSGYPAQMTSDAMSRVLLLEDAELAALIDLAGHELGAWRGYPQAAPTLEQVSAALAAAETLAGPLEG